MNGRRALLFVLSLILWFALSWSFSQKSIIAGIILSFLIALIAGGLFTQNPHKMLHLKRYLWFFAYCAILAWDMFKANIDVIFYIFNPKVRLEPKIVPVETALRSETGITALSNTINLIQGMTSVDIDDSSRILSVYFVRSSNYEKNLARIRKYEKILENIFEEK